MKWTVLRMLPNHTEKLMKENLKKERLRQQKFHELDSNHNLNSSDKTNPSLLEFNSSDESNADESTLLVKT